MTLLIVPGTPPETLYAGKATPVVGGIVTTMRLTNPTGTEQTAGFVSKMVGLPFKQGDMPAGDWPLLEVGGVACPATNWNATTWPDGSLKLVGCMARIPAAIPAASFVEVLVKRGGTLDTTPSRTTADLTAADLKTVLQGTLNLTGEWTASLNDGVTTGPVVLLGNGPAGALWRIGSEYRDGSSVAHEQLYQHHFVAGLTNSGGGVAGLRYMGRAMQMWGDYSTVTPTRRSFTAELRSGASVLRTIQSAQDTAGSLGTTVSMPHFTSWYTCGADGEYDFIPGTQSAECSVYWEHDPAYLVTTGVVGRMDTAITGLTPMPSVDYAANCKGNFQTYGINAATVKSEIGAMTRFGMLHLLNQDPVSLRSVRVNGLAIAGLPYRFISKSNQSIIPCVDFQPSYTNLNTPNNNLRFEAGKITSGSTNIVNPVDRTVLWSGDISPTHLPGTSWYPYVVTAEPQYLDQLTETASQVIMVLATGNNGLDTTFPITAQSITSRTSTVNSTSYKGTGWFCRSELPRMGAWSIRDITQAAALYPDVCPRGTQTRNYLRDLADAYFNFALVYRDAMPAAGYPAWVTEGHHFFKAGGSLWSNADFCMTVCHIADLYPTANAIEFRQHLSKLWNAVATHADMACPAAYISNTFEPGGRIQTVATMTWSCYSHMACRFDEGTDLVTIVGSAPWVPTQDDRFCFSSVYQPFAIVDTLEVFYAVNVSGLTFQLSATKGGAPISITNGTASTFDFSCGLQNYPGTYAFQRQPGAEDYFATIRGAVLAHRASGDDVALAHSKVQAKMPLVSVPYGSDPKYAYAGASNTTSS